MDVFHRLESRFHHMQHVLMADTIHTDAGFIPDTFVKVAGYVTGSPAIQWTEEDWNKHKAHAGLVGINQDPTSDPLLGNALDCERNAWGITQAVAASKKRAEHNRHTCIYVNLSEYTVLLEELKKADAKNVTIWLADWNLSMEEAVAKLDPSAEYPVVAVQWASPRSNPDTILPGTSLTLTASNVDLSVALEDWFPAPAPPKPEPEPEPKPEPAPVPPLPKPEPETIKGLVITNSLTPVPVQSTDGGKTWTEEDLSR